MRFTIVIHKDKDSDYGVIVPDLPGCYSAGDTADDAFSNAIEAIECHIEGLLADGEPIPAAKPLEFHQHNREYTGGLWAMVDVDLSKLSGQVKRINVTIPECILSQIDSYALSHGETRSRLLAHAALEYISSQSKS